MADRELISAGAARQMIRRGARPDDFAHLSVFRAGKILVRKILVRKDASETDRMISFILSNSHLDREGDSLAVPGWKTENYQKNPVLLWAHQHDGLPIGEALKTYVDGQNLQADDQFVDKDLYPFADVVYRMLDGGYLSACSVGFQPIEFELSATGVNFLQQELLEHSVCPVPAHPEALVVARSKGINTQPLVAWCERSLDLARASGDAAQQQRRQIETLRVQADAKGRKFFSVLPTLKLAEAADPDAERIAEMRASLAAVGSSLSSATDAAAALSTPPKPGASTEEVAAERQGALDEIAASCTTGAAALTAVGEQAVGLGAVRPKSTRRRGTPLIVDGSEIGDQQLLDITERDVAEAVARAVADAMMAVTGRVD